MKVQLLHSWKYGMRYLGLVLFLGLLGCAPASTIPTVNFDAPQIVIFNDEGGDPYDYARFWIKLEKIDKEVQLGECNSACTMLLSLPRACMMAGRRFGFHKPSGPVSVNFIARYMPGALRAEYLRDWSKSEKMIRRTAEQLKVLEPSLRICKTQPLSAR